MTDIREQIADAQRTKDLALDLLKQAAERRREAKNDYYHALRECIEAGVSNIKMGQVAGVSETAIRLYRKRNEMDGA